jgi:hypothetical protein
LKLKLGSAACFSSANANNDLIGAGATNIGFMLEFLITGTSTPESNAVVDCEMIAAPSASNPDVVTNWTFAPSFPTNQPLPVTFTMDYYQNTAGNMYAMRSILVERLY